MKLTDHSIRKLALPPGKTDHIVFDTDLGGFGLRIRAGGKKSWICQYRFGSQQRRFNIGSVHEVGATKARDTAADIFAKVRLGVDPQAERQGALVRASNTFGNLAERYLKRAKVKLRPRSYLEVERHLQKHWAPLNSKSVHAISRVDVAGQLSKLVETNGPIAANRARATLAAVFSWAMREGLVEGNPVVATNKAGEKTRDRVLSDRELVEIWNACRDDDYGRIVRLLILTGQRREEVGGIVRSEIDVAKRMWSLPKERTKNNLPHDVPLSDAAIDIFLKVPRREEHAHLFGQSAGRPFSGWSHARKALDIRIADAGNGAAPGSANRWTLHDIRRTVATGMAGIGIAPHIVEAVINHVSGHKGGVAGVYNKAAYTAEKRAALDRWAAHVLALVEGHESNIVALPKAAS